MAIVVKRKPLNFLEKLYLPEIVRGLSVTMRRMFEKPVTMEYPEVKPVIPPGYRGVPTLVKDPDGREKCVSCQLCEFVCPPKAIRITPGEIPESSDYAHVEKAPKEFEIDMLRCIYCGMCEEVCPEEAIWLQNQFSSSGYTRAEMVNDKEKLYALGGILPDRHFKWSKKKDAAEQGGGHH